MILGIDASNIRTGGGTTHLIEFLRAADPAQHCFSRIILWGSKKTLNQIEDYPWLVKSEETLLEKNLFFRIFWQRFKLSKLARENKCDLLFVPGGSYAGDFYPIVVMSQNLLPFEWRELSRFRWSWMTLKLILLRFTQSRSFRLADGLIFLNQYASKTIREVTKINIKKMAIVPHGIDQRFIVSPRPQLPLHHYSVSRPYRILYVSTIDVYKHQWHVAEAISLLRKKGLPIELEMVGPAYPPALARLKKVLNRVDPEGHFAHYRGAVPYQELHHRYAEADLCLFASSCENMPNILLEGMASGLPIACSNRGPMPEMLGEASVYFDPENPEEIAEALQKLLESPELRFKIAQLSFEQSKNYSWKRCSHETFQFLTNIVQNGS